MKKLPDALRRVGLVANPDKPASRRVARQALALVLGSGRELLTDARTAEFAGVSGVAFDSVAALAKHCDLLLVLGGDGTMLGVARDAAGSNTPILGINLGRLGFLTASSAARLADTLERVWSGDCVVESRSLIEATGRGRQGAIRELALNDFVISHGMVPRLIELEVQVDGEVLTSYRGDGLIVSSPTGSTAYSLAAGGAVVSPQAEVFALTPICPHTLSNRSVIVSLSSTVQVRLLSERVDTFLAADGQMRAELQAGDYLQLRRSRHTAQLVRLRGSSFFETLRQKLNWSGSTG